MNKYFWPKEILVGMSAKPPFLKIHLRAIAQATELKERVGQALLFASGTEEIHVEETVGHFGNPILIFEMELKKARDMNTFLQILKDAGILNQVMEEIDFRLDDECNLYFRLDKQKAFEEHLAIAENKDVIAVSMKVAAYPARRENALVALDKWLSN